MNTVFAQSQFDAAHPDGIQDLYWHQVRSRILSREIRALAGPSSRVVEVGCGRGVVVKLLRESGVNAVGIEPGRVVPLAGIEPHVLAGRAVNEVPERLRNQCDVLLLLDVIEHIEEPAAFMREVMRVFPSARYCLITVPARPELWSNFDLHYGHFRRYTTPMVRDLAASLGWRLLKGRYFFHFLYLPLFILRFFQMERSLTMRAPKGALKILHRWIGRLGDLEDRMIPGAVPGASILAIFSVSDERLK